MGADQVEYKVLGQSLRTRLWKTKGSRFVARERLRSTNTISITTVTMLSVYVIVLSVILLAFSDQLNALNAKWLNVVNIGLSVLIIVFSLIESSKDHLGGAEVMNQSGLRLGEIYGLLSAKMEAGSLTALDLEKMEFEYANALKESRLNHTTQDYLVFVIQNWREFPEIDWMANGLFRSIAFLSISLRYYWLYVVSLGGFPLLAAMFGRNFLSVS